MSSRLERLTERRRNLQLQCELQRDEVRLIYGGIERSTGRADRVLEAVRRTGPLLAVGGALVLVFVGPGKALRALSRGLTVALYASHALRVLR